MYTAWIVIILISIIIGIITSQSYFIFMSLGAIISLVLNINNVGFIEQCIVFIIVNIIGFIIYYFAQLHNNHKKITTNAQSLIGKEAIVIETIAPFHPGYVKISGQKWMAEANETINQNEVVKVDNISGCHLIVSK